MSIRLYVGNLPEDLTRQELEAVFVEEGDGVSA
ncbi:MAG: RNA-binding protein, partial [Phormidesmis sp. CAN_BIN44]|nr:RNA-binding protein [Phormidesmis sp. CAN_BIN44]